MDDILIALRCPVKLVERLDACIQKGEYMNRSDAGRDLLRLGLQIKEREMNEEKQTVNYSLCVPAD